MFQCFVCSGVLQGWSAGYPWGDERWKAGNFGHNDSGSRPCLPHEEGICQDDGEEACGKQKTMNIQSWLKWSSPFVYNRNFVSTGRPSIPSSTTCAHSWMWNTGHGWRCTTRSSLSWRALRLRRSCKIWRRTMRRWNPTWLLPWPRRRNWRRRWCLFCRRRTICSCKWHLWVEINQELYFFYCVCGMLMCKSTFSNVN